MTLAIGILIPEFKKGKTNRRHVTGFTLLVVLVVLLIIGIVLNVVLLSVDFESEDQQLKQEARRMTQLLQLATEEAILQAKPIGMRIDEDSYRFLVFEEESWAASQDPLFRERQIPELVELDLELDTVPPTEQPEDMPQILFLEGGELTPFTLTLYSPSREHEYNITGHADGSVLMSTQE